VNEAPRQYLCPDCGFRIFNRRHPRCEACGQTLPQALLFSAEERIALDAEHEKSRRERERLEQARRRRQSDQISDSPFVYGDFGGAGFGSDSGGDAGGGSGGGHH